MKVEEIEVSRLISDPRNARKHDARSVDAICASIEAFGQQKPIVVSTDNVVIAGNGMLAAAQKMGWKTIKCVRTDLKGEKATAFAIADNRTAELSDWDDSVLKNLLNEMSPDGLQATGWDAAEIDAMLASVVNSMPSEFYEPILEPEFGDGKVTERDIDRANSVFNVTSSANVKIDIVCPHCGEDFKIDRP